MNPHELLLDPTLPWEAHLPLFDDLDDTVQAPIYHNIWRLKLLSTIDTLLHVPLFSDPQDVSKFNIRLVLHPLRNWLNDRDLSTTHDQRQEELIRYRHYLDVLVQRLSSSHLPINIPAPIQRILTQLSISSQVDDPDYLRIFYTRFTHKAKALLTYTEPTEGNYFVNLDYSDSGITFIIFGPPCSCPERLPHLASFLSPIFHHPAISTLFSPV
jgi:hypothetical protein